MAVKKAVKKGQASSFDLQGVGFDVTQDPQQVFVLLDRGGFEPLLPDVAARLVMPMIRPHVGGQHQLRPAA